MSTNILVLAAGQVCFETHDGGYPLCLTETDGMSLLEKIVDNTKSIDSAKYCFALLEKDAQKFHLDKIAKLLAPSATVIRVPESTKGSACTALLASSQLDHDDDLLIISANELVDINFADVIADFKQRALQGGTLIFPSVHPRYSYVRTSEEGLVLEAAQQNPISNNATVGVFWYEKTGDFIEAAKNLIRKNASVDERFFVAPTFNELILKQLRVGVMNMDVNKYKPLKTERQVYKFESGLSQ